MDLVFTGSHGADGLDGLAAALGRAGDGAADKSRAVVKKGAVNIKKDWAAAWSGFAHAPAVGRAVSFDVTDVLGGGSAEIGPDKGRPQGALGNLIEYGSVNNAPHPGGAPALEAETPNFVREIEKIGLDALDQL